MSIWGQRVSINAVAVGALLLVAGALLAAVARPPAREITLVARGMAFYLEQDPDTPNPAITVTAGERVRVVLRNQDRGFTHDLAVPAFGASVRALNWSQSGETIIDVPDTPGTYEYVCTPHRLMMTGTLRVLPRRVQRISSID